MNYELIKITYILLSLRTIIIFFEILFKILHKNFPNVQTKYYLCTIKRNLCNGLYTKL